MEEVKLPIKTKIAALWLIVFGLLKMILGAFFTLPSFALPQFSGSLLGLLLFIAGFLVIRRKKAGWWLGTILLSMQIILSLFMVFAPYPAAGLLGVTLFLAVLFLFPFLPSYYSFAGRLVWLSNFLLLIPLLLLLLDRKNFWRITSKTGSNIVR